MTRSCFALAMVILPLIAGCGGSFSLFLSVGGGTTPGSVVVASDPRTDGDIRQDGLVTTGAVLAFSAFGSPGVAVGSVFAGIRLLPSASPQPVSFGVIPELQSDVDDPSVRFFQLRIFGTGGLAQIVDGAEDRAGSLPPDPGRAPVLSVQFRF